MYYKEQHIRVPGVWSLQHVLLLDFSCFSDNNRYIMVFFFSLIYISLMTPVVRIFSGASLSFEYYLQSKYFFAHLKIQIIFLLQTPHVSLMRYVFFKYFIPICGFHFLFYPWLEFFKTVHNESTIKSSVVNIQSWPKKDPASFPSLYSDFQYLLIFKILWKQGSLYSLSHLDLIGCTVFLL